MKTIVTIGRELLGLFVDDGALAFAILAVVIVCVGLNVAGASSLVVGTTLFLGCIAVLIESVWRASRNGMP
jgi:hypothetical protein